MTFYSEGLFKIPNSVQKEGASSIDELDGKITHEIPEVSPEFIDNQAVPFVEKIVLKENERVEIIDFEEDKKNEKLTPGSELNWRSRIK